MKKDKNSIINSLDKQKKTEITTCDNTAKTEFLLGFKDAIPVMIGYFAVALTFGVISVDRGLPLWAPTFISLTCVTGTGQFVGVDLISSAASLLEIVGAILVINARYFLMSMSLSQKLPPEIKFWQRFVIAYGNTDENYAIAMARTKPVTFAYFTGLIASSVSGWVFGTVLGSFIGNIVPESITSAMSVALYAMYIAIVVPQFVSSLPVCMVVVISCLISCIIKYVPIFSFISSGWSVIVAGIAAAAVGSLVFPVKDEEDKKGDERQ